MENADQQLVSVASLGDGLRRRLYQLVVERGCPVGRDEAAQGVDVSRGLAAYHLDRLVDEGLLTARFERLGTRRGPGAGRPAKLYERSKRQFSVQLPPRHYELAAAVLAEVIAVSPDRQLPDRVHDVAREFGRTIAGGSTLEGATASAPREQLLATMDGCGYEPVDADGVIRFRNCPFDVLARDHRDLVCGMNLAFVRGLLDDTDGSGLHAVLDPRPGECCVTLRPTA